MNSLLVEVHFDAVRYDHGTLDAILFSFCSLVFSRYLRLVMKQKFAGWFITVLSRSNVLSSFSQF